MTDKDIHLCAGTLGRPDQCCWMQAPEPMGLCEEPAKYIIVYKVNSTHNLVVHHHYCIKHAAIARENSNLSTCQTLDYQQRAGAVDDEERLRR